MEDTPDCEECGHNLFELDGDWFCPACDSIAGFELRPQQEEFTL